MEKFEPDMRLTRNAHLIANLGLCQLRLVDDSRWAWLTLVPQRPDISEVFELTPLDQTMLTFETNLVASALKGVTRCTKINVAAIGNIVRQLHVHVVARNEGDANWPNPIWGHGDAHPYTEEARKRLVETLMKALHA
ncbi:diadenosine tetraphosphate (Ap4A) HIT family hydrolase [Rhizobium aquaticum]|uniref:Diadenosine tetraphosphate (Ap4A) HIT family hydrolase n=1 Tax=Rhizobium aquaticum TaxID=1549636 RepID=A0ABV2IZH1_9HYPH